MNEYTNELNKKLVPKADGTPLVLDLFAGCGGLSLGFEAQGFATVGYELDADCCETYRRNLRGECHQLTLTPGTPLPSAPFIIGGPPCQPFSVGGHQLGLKDSRDGFPIFLAAIKHLQPDFWMFENVRGLLYTNKWYFDEILQAAQVLGYIVEYRLMNAVDYGVPQNRERIVVVGHRGEFHFPEPVRKKVTAGDALADILYQTPPESKFLTPSMDEYVAKYEKASFCIRPRDLRLDEPARTLTCRNLAGATGDMQRIRLPDGRRRRLLLREAARLQSFPDFFNFSGSETSCFNQVGNAVAPLFAFRLAAAVREYMQSSVRLPSSEIVYRNLPAQMTLELIKENVDMQVPEFVTSEKKTKAVRKLINRALLILNKFGVPFDGLTSRRLELMALSFLAVAGVKRATDWQFTGEESEKKPLKTRDIIDFVNKNYGEEISSGSYDDIRRKHLLLPVTAGIILKSAANSNAARNDPTRGYAISPDYLGLVREFGSASWEDDVEEFMAERESLADQLAHKRAIETIPVTPLCVITTDCEAPCLPIAAEILNSDFRSLISSSAANLSASDGFLSSTIVSCQLILKSSPPVLTCLG